MDITIEELLEDLNEVCVKEGCAYYHSDFYNIYVERSDNKWIIYDDDLGKIKEFTDTDDLIKCWLSLKEV